MHAGVSQRLSTRLSMRARISTMAPVLALLSVASGLRLPTASRTFFPRGATKRSGGSYTSAATWHRGTRTTLQMTTVGAALAVNSVFAAAGIVAKQRVLTPAGLAHSWVLGVARSPAHFCVKRLRRVTRAGTKIKKLEKEKAGIAEARGGARGPENVWGSAATAALCAIGGSVYVEWQSYLALGFVASIATKLSDTIASEIGKAYGKTTYLITTLQKVPRGTEGAVSLEGTVAGAVASVFIAGYASVIGLVPVWPGLPAAIIAAFVATTFESYLGATVQGKIPILTNEVVNFLNTLVGASTGILLARPFL